MATRRATREEWTARITKWKASGASASAFAREHGLNVGSLKWWAWRLSSSKVRASSAKRALAPRGPSPVTKATILSPLTFVELTAPVEIDPLEVVLPSSVRIRVRPGFDAQTLGRVLDAKRLRLLEERLEIKWTIHSPRYGLKWTMRPLVARLRNRREPSRFRIYVAQKSS